MRKSEDCPTSVSDIAFGDDWKPWRRRTGPINSIVSMFYYVYLIRSIKYPDTVYVGYTTNFKQRLETYNSGGSIHTRKHRPWELVMFLGFVDKLKATSFEKYLKSHSGRAFASKRFW